MHNVAETKRMEAFEMSALNNAGLMSTKLTSLHHVPRTQTSMNK